MTPTQSPAPAGIVVSSQIVAGELPGLATNHAEGLVA
jgi:hypothetical protein